MVNKKDDACQLSHENFDPQGQNRHREWNGAIAKAEARKLKPNSCLSGL